MTFQFRCTAFVGITIDGFIARKDCSIDYLPPAPASDASSQPVCKVPTIADMLANSDVLVLGRNTYEQVIGFGEDQWPYGDKQLILLTTRPTDGLELRAGVQTAGSIDEVLKIISSKGNRDVWVDGGATISSFLDRELVTEMVLSTVPIAIGTGIPLFQNLKKDLKLDIVASEVLDNLLTTKYRVQYDNK